MLEVILISCFVLIECKRKFYLDLIITELLNLDGVSFIYKIIKGGPYDLLLKIHGYDRNDLGDKVSVISKFNKVNMTVSLIIDSPSE